MKNGGERHDKRRAILRTTMALPAGQNHERTHLRNCLRTEWNAVGVTVKTSVFDRVSRGLEKISSMRVELTVSWLYASATRHPRDRSRLQ
jgi:hypothetical protein